MSTNGSALKEAKLALKEAKADMTAAKKIVLEKQKAFLGDTLGAEAAKEYRQAVAGHIAAAKAFSKANNKVEKLSA